MARTPVRQRRPAARRSGSREVHPQWGRKFTYGELAAAWIGAGGPASEASTAAAVALAESGGYEKRPNSTGDGGMGPWQITPAEPGSDTLRGNARQAVRKWKGAKKSLGSAEKAWANQWVAYANGSYKQFKLPGKGDFDKSFLESLATGSVGDAINTAIKPLEPLAALGELALGLTELLLTPEGWRRLLKVIIGGIVLLWALNQLSKSIFDVNPAKATVRTAAKAATLKGAVS